MRPVVMSEGKWGLHTLLVAVTNMTIWCGFMWKSWLQLLSEDWFFRQGQTALCRTNDATWQTVVKWIQQKKGKKLSWLNVCHAPLRLHIRKCLRQQTAFLFPSAPSPWIPRIHETRGQLGMKRARHKCVTFPRLSALRHLSPSWLSVNKCNAAAELQHGRK